MFCTVGLLDSMWSTTCTYVCTSQLCYAACRFVTEHLDEWRALFDSSTPHLEQLPAPWQSRLGPFQRLLLLRALRQDKLTQAITKYVADTMGT